MMRTELRKAMKTLNGGELPVRAANGKTDAKWLYDFARNLGVSSWTVRRWLRGDRIPPSKAKLIRMLVASHEQAVEIKETAVAIPADN